MFILKMKKNCNFAWHEISGVVLAIIFYASYTNFKQWAWSLRPLDQFEWGHRFKLCPGEKTPYTIFELILFSSKFNKLYNSLPILTETKIGFKCTLYLFEQINPARMFVHGNHFVNGRKSPTHCNDWMFIHCVCLYRRWVCFFDPELSFCVQFAIFTSNFFSLCLYTIFIYCFFEATLFFYSIFLFCLYIQLGFFTTSIWKTSVMNHSLILSNAQKSYNRIVQFASCLKEKYNVNRLFFSLVSVLIWKLELGRIYILQRSNKQPSVFLFSTFSQSDH